MSLFYHCDECGAQHHVKDPYQASSLPTHWGEFSVTLYGSGLQYTNIKKTLCSLCIVKRGFTPKIFLKDEQTKNFTDQFYDLVGGIVQEIMENQ